LVVWWCCFRGGGLFLFFLVVGSLSPPDAPNRAPNPSSQQTVFESGKNVTPVRFDPLSTSLYFNYREEQQGRLRQLWFDDPSTLRPKMRVAAREGLRGLGFWNVDLVASGGGGASAKAQEQTRAMWAAVAEVVGEWAAGRGGGGGDATPAAAKAGETAVVRK